MVACRYPAGSGQPSQLIAVSPGDDLESARLGGRSHFRRPKR